MFAPTPEPPYTAVIFTAVEATPADPAYAVLAERLHALALVQPGFLGIESAAGPPEITVSYWASAADARAWKAVAEHLEGQRLGRERWYEAYRVRIATVEREYGSVARHP